MNPALAMSMGWTNPNVTLSQNVGMTMANATPNMNPMMMMGMNKPMGPTATNTPDSMSGTVPSNAAMLNQMGFMMNGNLAGSAPPGNQTMGLNPMGMMNTGMSVVNNNSGGGTVGANNLNSGSNLPNGTGPNA
ncbi:hypothetical protein IWQ62_006955 [Dispira parvispora]|uniref:Uncharacterized protein n=1 Tax=Dispira parvispora TaxID=1520584 RepID=A0A9W8E395_9FUNG|nr:hypothetical protein IWQ62_006955 [Dispira parvispora]